MEHSSLKFYTVWVSAGKIGGLSRVWITTGTGLTRESPHIQILLMLMSHHRSRGHYCRQWDVQTSVQASCTCCTADSRSCERCKRTQSVAMETMATSCWHQLDRPDPPTKYSSTCSPGQMLVWTDALTPGLSNVTSGWDVIPLCYVLMWLHWVRRHILFGHNCCTYDMISVSSSYRPNSRGTKNLSSLLREMAWR